MRSHRDWTGLWAFAGSAAARHSFTFLHEGHYRRAVARADDARNVRPADFQETAILEIGTVEAGLAAAFAAAVKAGEASLREAQRGVVGMAQVLEVSPLARPVSSSRSPMPLCFASSCDGWATFVAGWRSFVHAYRAASERFRRGVLDVAFPRGAFRPSCWSG